MGKLELLIIAEVESSSDFIVRTMNFAKARCYSSNLQRVNSNSMLVTAGTMLATRSFPAGKYACVPGELFHKGWNLGATLNALVYAESAHVPDCSNVAPFSSISPSDFQFQFFHSLLVAYSMFSRLVTSFLNWFAGARNLLPWLKIVGFALPPMA